MNRRTPLIALVAPVLLALCLRAQAQTVVAYEFHDLGQLAAGLNTVANDISSNNQITGTGRYGGYNRTWRISPRTDPVTGSPVWFLDAGGGANAYMEMLPLPGSSFLSSGGNAINDSGAVAGTSYGSSYVKAATAWPQSGPTATALTSGLNSSQASEGYAINNLGDVVGWLNGKMRGAIWQYSAGHYTQVALNYPSGYAGDIAFGVNDNRLVVGALYDSGGSPVAACYWAPGSTTVAVLGGRLAYCANNAGYILGNAYVTDAVTGQSITHPVLWDPNGTPLDIAASSPYWYDCGGGGASGGRKINASNQVIGSGSTRPGEWRPFVYDPASGMQDLGQLLADPQNGPQTGLTGVNGINDSGLIVGTWNLNGVARGFVLTPTATLPAAAAPPAGPAGLTASGASSTEVQVAWAVDATGSNGVKVCRGTNGANFNQIAVLDPGATAYHDTGLKQACIYYYRVSSFNVAGFADSGAVSVITPGAPVAPTNLKVSSSATTQVSLSWTNNSTNQAIDVERSRDGVTFTVIAVGLAAATTKYQDATVSAGTSYTYRLRCYNADGASYSNAVSVTTPKR